MASAAPDTENRGGDRAKQAAAALLLARRRYSLPTLIAQTKTKPRPFRPIRPTEALKSDLANPYFQIVRAWARETDAMMQAYATGDAATIQRQGNSSAVMVALIVAAAQRVMPVIVSRVEQWHRQQWLSRVRASTGLDVSMLTAADDVAADMAAATTWNQQLAGDVHQQTRHGIATALLVGVAVSASPKEVQARVADVIAKAKRRSAGIADDQVDKASRAFDRSRRAAAGIDQYMWLHTPQRGPRNWHLARNGKTFGPGDIDPNDRAGVPPFCKCFEIPYLQ